MHQYLQTYQEHRSLGECKILIKANFTGHVAQQPPQIKELQKKFTEVKIAPHSYYLPYARPTGYTTIPKISNENVGFELFSLYETTTNLPFSIHCPNSS